MALICLVAIEGCKSRSSKASNASGAAESGRQFDDYFIDACTHVNNGNYDVALKLFNKCKDLKPEEASVYYEISRVYDKNNDNTLSLQYAMKAFQYAPQNKFYALWYAGKLRQNRQVDQAIEILEKAFNDNRKDEMIVKELDNLYASKGDTQKRISLWNNYREAANYKLGTALKLIELYKSQKDYQSAHRMYDEIKKASPAKYQYFIDDANLYLEHNDEVNANINFEKAIQINPNNWKINYALYQSYRKKNDKEKAGHYLGLAFADINTSFDSKINACVELKNETKADPSLKYYTNIVATQLVAVYPENANALLTAAKFFEENDDAGTAFETYKKAYTINPNLFDAWMGAISSSEKLKLPAMTEISEQALEYYPNVALLYASAAKGYNQQKQYAKALDLATSGKSFALDNEARFQLLMQEGIALLNLKKYTEAEKSLEAALAINSSEKELYDQVGNVKFFLNKVDEAVSNWQKAKELGLNNKTLDRKINDRKFYE